MCTTEPLDRVEGAKDEAIRRRNELVMENLGLAYEIAKKYPLGGVEYQDRVQDGVFGLIRAAEKFDPGRGLKFSTCATPWIKREIHMGIVNAGRTIYVPRVPVAGHVELARYDGAKLDELYVPPSAEPVEDAVPARWPAVERAMRERLNPRHRRLLELQYGLGGGLVHDAREAAKVLGYHPESVGNARDRAVAVLSAALSPAG